ncbi:MAG: hypothetical protein O9262_07265, partial [Cyclobacteriaceae bacterium]|nr:hypothetical protein [Cyclobacteriaceae bacterium]
MRFIDTTGFTHADFNTQAPIKEGELAALDPVNNDSYKSYLKLQANSIWTVLRPSFELLSKGKCWYTEADSNIADLHIDHFRPKKRVSLLRNLYRYNEARKSACKKGYWWLCYKVSNYRLAGPKPNNRKRNYFPLRSDSPIGVNGTPSWTQEIPMLLDPCVKTDVSLLSFSGITPEPSNPDRTSIDNIRAAISIKVYDLDSDKLRKAKSGIYAKLKLIVSSAEQNWHDMQINNHVNPEAFGIAARNFADD